MENKEDNKAIKESEVKEEKAKESKKESKISVFISLPEWQKYIMFFLLNTVISVGITVFILTNYFIRPIAIVDLKGIIDNEKKTLLLSKDIDNEKKIEEMAKRIESISYEISKKKEIILIKDAVLNYETLRDYTDEIRNKKQNR